MAMPSTGRRFWTLSGRGMKTIITIAVLMFVTPAGADNIYLTESGTCATGYVRDGRFCVAIETGYVVRSCPRSTFRSGDFCKVKPIPRIISFLNGFQISAFGLGSLVSCVT